MKTKLTATLIVTLFLITFWMLGAPAGAQQRTGNAARPNVSPTPSPIPTPLEPKIETSGGWKLETKYSNRQPSGPAVLAEESSSTQRTATTTPGTQKTSNTIDVGIIPGRAGCPAGSDLISIRMDSEDDKNANTSSGWIGATAQDTNITFKFCRVDGSKFSTPLTSAYAVLQLNEFACPLGSYSFWREFDNEKNQNNNAIYILPSHSSLGVLPNKQWHNSPFGHSFTRLCFCVFSSNTQTPVGIPGTFPDFGMEYGVFAPSDLHGILAAGSLHSDDQDKGNRNDYSDSYDANKPEASRIVSDDINTDLQFAKVKAGPPLPNLHSVSLNVSSVQGGNNGRNPILTVALDGPAPPGGMKVEVSSSEPNIAWVMGTGYFMIPEGKTSDYWEEFLGTRKVWSNKSLTLRVTVNGKLGVVNLAVKK